MNNHVYFEGGEIYKLSSLILRQPHVLIGGTTRSGKSVLINTVICDAMRCGGLFSLIDLKGVELDIYKDLPFCINYCDNIFKVETAIDEVISLMDKRFKDMKSQGIRKSTETDFYLVIDEYVDIKYSREKGVDTREIENKLMRIVSKGAAANIHVILCTQHCTSQTLSTNIKALFVSTVGLRVRNAQESRNIIGENGCEDLPMYGECYVITPEQRNKQLWKIDMYSDEQIKQRIKEFTDFNNKKKEENKLQNNMNLLRIIFGDNKQ